MEEVHKSKDEIRAEMAAKIEGLPDGALQEKTRLIEERVFDFANYLEARVVLMYLPRKNEVNTDTIIRRTFDLNKIVVLPRFEPGSKKIQLFKVDDLQKELTPGSSGRLQPDPARCRAMPIDSIDIAIVPGIVFDEKGGRIGFGEGFFDRVIPNLPITTRKVALALDEQVLSQIPSESLDKSVDIIITDRRIIYKI